jgi:hypothetical protein
MLKPPRKFGRIDGEQFAQGIKLPSRQFELPVEADEDVPLSFILPLTL